MGLVWSFSASILMGVQTRILINLLGSVRVNNIYIRINFLVLLACWRELNITLLPKLSTIYKKNWTMRKNSKNAFTLIEALVSVAITAIGFAGVIALVSTSNDVMSKSYDKEKLKFQNTEIMEVLNGDQANIMEYNGKDLSQCADLVTSEGKEEQLARLKNWCNKIQGEVGNKRTQDSRIIRVERRVIGDEAVFIVSLEMSGKNDKSVFMKRVIYEK
jgi:type II secretory pathway pseudopilin PulG